VCSCARSSGTLLFDLHRCAGATSRPENAIVNRLLVSAKPLKMRIAILDDYQDHPLFRPVTDSRPQRARALPDSRRTVIAMLAAHELIGPPPGPKSRRWPTTVSRSGRLRPSGSICTHDYITGGFGWGAVTNVAQVWPFGIDATASDLTTGGHFRMARFVGTVEPGGKHRTVIGSASRTPAATNDSAERDIMMAWLRGQGWVEIT
jgi:hypothetical protein